MRLRHLPLLAPITVLLTGAVPAQATTFCVPGFTAACPNNGTNVAQANLEAATTTKGSDGVADRVVIAAGTYSDSESLDPLGKDPLELVGAGTGTTVLTSDSFANVYVVNLVDRGAATLRDLTIRVPATFPDGAGAAVQGQNTTYDHVNVESRNVGALGLDLGRGSAFRDGRIYGTIGGTFREGISSNGGYGQGTATIERTRIENTEIGVSARDGRAPIVVRRSVIVQPTFVGVDAFNDGQVAVENTIVALTGAGDALRSQANGTADPVLTARHVTLLGIGGTTGRGVASIVNPGTSGNASLTLTDSIVRGFASPYLRQAPAGAATGDANLTIRTSNLPKNGTATGDGALSLGPNINADPMFVGLFDLHLQPGSPSIDAADAAPGGLTEDFGGALRPTDGNGDGTAVADQGAYEYQPPSAPPADPSDPGGPPPADPGNPNGPTVVVDTTAPVLSAVTARPRLRARRGGRLRFRVSEAAKVTLTLTPTRAHRRKVTVTVLVPAGAATLTVRARALRRQRYRLALVATDAAGNRSATVRRTARVER